MTGYVLLHAMRRALSICNERTKTDERDWFFYAIDGDQHIAYVQTEN